MKEVKISKQAMDTSIAGYRDLIKFAEAGLKELESDNMFKKLESMKNIRLINEFFGLFHESNKIITRHVLCVLDDRMKSSMEEVVDQELDVTLEKFHFGVEGDDESEDESEGDPDIDTIAEFLMKKK